ncbi:MAG TPA: hypothetical protein VEK34_11935 [Methylocella sp.]|nr:hypothetical protein [Methylocella sp.]
MGCPQKKIAKGSSYFDFGRLIHQMAIKTIAATIIPTPIIAEIQILTGKLRRTSP